MATYPGRYHKIGIADLRAVSTDQSRTFTYTILAEEAVPLPGKSDILMVVLGAAIILITVIIGISVLQIKRPYSREK